MISMLCRRIKRRASERQVDSDIERIRVTSGLSNPGDRSLNGSEVSVVSRREFLIGSAASAILAVGGLSFASTDQKPPVKVGFILPEHGDSAGEAKSIFAGFELFLKEKGADAPALEILKRDPGPDDGKILEAVADLVVNREVQFLIGPPTLDGSERIIHGLTEGKTIIFLTHPAIRLVAGELCLPRAFRVHPNSYQSVNLMAPWALKNVGVKIFITGDDDVQANEEADIFAQGFERSGGTFADRVMLSAPSGKMKTVIDAITEAKPDFIFASFHGVRSAAFLKALRGATPSLQQPVLGPEQLTAVPQTLASLGKLCSGVKTLTSMKNPYEFVAKIKENLQIDVSDAARAAEGHDIAAIISGVVSSNWPETDPAKIVERIKGMEIDGPRGQLSFDENHEPILDVMVQEWIPEGTGFKQSIIENLGRAKSPDFGCGRVGFPRRLEAEPKDEGQDVPRSDDVLWEEESQ